MLLHKIDDPNVILETITSQKTYLSVKRLEKTVEESPPKKQLKTKVPDLDRPYKNYSDFTRETFIDRMIEKPEERGLVTKVANNLNINYRTALRWWNSYKETEEIPYKKSEENSGPKSSFTAKHNEYLQGLLDNYPQLFSDDIMKSLTENLKASLSQSRN